MRMMWMVLIMIIPRHTGTDDDDEDDDDSDGDDPTSSHRHCSPFLSTQLQAPQFRVAWVHFISSWTLSFNSNIFFHDSADICCFLPQNPWSCTRCG